MKLNFWQWIGIVIVVIALIVIIRRETGERGGPQPNRATEPAPQSSPQPAVEVPSTPATPTTAPATP